MGLLSSRSSRLTATVAFAALLTLPRWPAALQAAEQRVADPKDLPKFPPVAEGDSHAGLIVNEAASSVTVRQPLGVEVVVARAQIATMKASTLSLMPEGLEEGLGNQDLADLMDFIFAGMH